MKNPFARSLNTELIALFVTVSVISIVSVAVLSFIASQNALEVRITEQLESEAKHRTQTLKYVWNLRLDEIKILAANQIIQNMLSESNKKEKGEIVDESALKKMVDNFIKQEWPEFTSSTGDEHFYDLVIIDKSGKVISSTDKSVEGKDFSQDPDFVRGTKESFYYLGMNKQKKQSTLFMVVPVVNSRTEETESIGVIIASRDMALANKITTDRTNLGKTGETYLVNHDKLMLTDSRFIQKAAFYQTVDTLPVRECIENGHDLTGVYPDYRRIPVFGASHCEQDLGFVFLAEMDVSETYAPVDELQNQYVIIGSITAVIVAILSFYISSSISKPIVKLTVIAEKISKGHLDTEVEELKSENEIGKLLHSFKMMMLNLRHHIEKVESLSEELKSANEELMQIDKLKTEFISIASHELKNPIQPILGFAYLAKSGQIPHDEAWDGVLQHSRRLKKLAGDILDVSRIESGTLTYTMEKVRINDIVLNVVNAATVSISKDVAIEVNLDRENVEIDASKDRITQVLSNVIDNAMKFTKKGSIKVESCAFPKKNYVEIKISDTGIGIAEDILPNLFGKFVSRSTQDGFDRDTGLGLFIAKAIVTAHNGRISGYNNKAGGATFLIELLIDAKPEML